LRAIDRELALEVLHCVDRYLTTRTGNLKKLLSPRVGFRLRCGDYRIFFRQIPKESITITGVRHRRDAYR
jgi:mRNA-degrading endonuclease RelE of RelBE toxin-antitoxin system